MNNDFSIRVLGPRAIHSPLDRAFFIGEDEGILFDATVSPTRPPCASPVVLEAAGPRRKLFFQPEKVKAAIVTCGGLCPGLNDVVRSLTMVMWYRYGVRDIVGLRYGYEGLIPSFGHQPIPLNPAVVEDIHQHGGTILGSSRGEQAVAPMVDFLVANGIQMLFTIGGDGTQRGALEIADEMAARGLANAVVGIPKTIDNDIMYTERTFGFETAVAVCRSPITAAHMEAKGVHNGVGLVRLMGRDSGFVAAYASLASSDVNLVLVPEVPFRVERVLAWLEERLARKSHALIVVAEGAGQDLVAMDGTDASGNRKLGDIGVYLKERITAHFKGQPRPATVKYIDPSYTIRSAPADADDSVFCFQLGENAVHAAMSGRTAMVVGLWNNRFVHVPMARAVERRKKLDPHGSFWQSVLENTGQPVSLV